MKASDKIRARKEDNMKKLVMLVISIFLVACSGDNGETTDVLLDAGVDVADVQVPTDVTDVTIPDDATTPDADAGLTPDADTVAPPDAEITQPVDVVELVDVNVPPDVEPELEELLGELQPETGPEDVEPQPCELDFDCEPGFSCNLGFCAPAEPECETEDECEDGEICLEGICLQEGVGPDLGKLLVNELLSDGDTDEDPNDDGTIDSMEDEFIEIVNVSNETVDLSGWKLVELDWDVWLPRHTFADGFTLEPGEVLVIFGGGDPPESADGVIYMASNAEDPGIPYGLDLDDDGDAVRLIDADELTVALLAYGDGGSVAAVSDQSLTRDPDLTGGFVPHTLADGAQGAIFSPGAKTDGSVF